MRFRIELEIVDPARNILPINYQYELGSWIYNVIRNGDPRFASWLHQRGYAGQKKSFRLFTFSNLMIPARVVKGDRIEIQSATAGLMVSFLPEDKPHQRCWKGDDKLRCEIRIQTKTIDKS